MFPNPIEVGPLNISHYGIMVALGVVAAMILFSFTAPRRGVNPAMARDFCFWMVIAGLLGSRIAYVVFHWPEFSGRPMDVLAYWRGGLMFQGGVVAALLLSPFILKRYMLPFWPTADTMVPSLAIGQAFGRLGCFAAGCCFGRPTTPDNPLSMAFPYGGLAPAGIPLWPAQLIESAGLFALTFILIGAVRSQKRFFSCLGRVAALYLFGAGTLRFLMDYYIRGDYRGEPVLYGFPPTTVAAAAAAALGLALLFLRRPTPGSRSWQLFT